MTDKTRYCPWQKTITSHKNTILETNEVVFKFGLCLKDFCPFYDHDSMPHCRRAIAEVKRKEKS